MQAALGLLAISVLLLGCATPPSPAGQELPQDVVRGFLEAQRSGRDAEATTRWGFGTDAFQATGGSSGEAAIRADIRRKAQSGLPRAFAIGETEYVPPDREQAFVQVWIDQPQQGPASLYELVRTRDGWKIVGYAAAPNPPLHTPQPQSSRTR